MKLKQVKEAFQRYIRPWDILDKPPFVQGRWISPVNLQRSQIYRVDQKYTCVSNKSVFLVNFFSPKIMIEIMSFDLEWHICHLKKLSCSCKNLKKLLTINLKRGFHFLHISQKRIKIFKVNKKRLKHRRNFTKKKIGDSWNRTVQDQYL